MKQRPLPSDLTRGRSLARLLGAGTVLALLLGTGQVQAQADLRPAAPDLLLLVDTSGSMDYKTGSSSFPTCKFSGTNVAVPAQSSERSRWIDLVEVMTGSIKDYECQRLDRNSSDFRTEYALNTSPPYDALYPNPYHRPANGECVLGPGALDAMNPALFPGSALKAHLYDNTTSSCDFNQSNDGVMDSFVDEVRFALMTFDTEPSPAKDVGGLWSYYLSSGRKGEPAGCLVPQDQEVGVRNADAPPWEGRAVGFGDPAPGSSDFKTRNDMIQRVLLATRPYGATPIAGMLDDARAYMLSDTTNDPINAGIPFGPSKDPAIDRADPCRKRAIILLSDGQPNMDLRPYCEPSGCPYDKSEDIAQNLKSQGIDLYVIGFALSKVVVGGVERTCKSFADSDFDATNPTGICNLNPNDGPIQACCALNRIAAAGGHSPASGTDEDWRRAHFADSRDELRVALAKAIGANFTATTRVPVVPIAGYGFVNSETDFAAGFRFGASIKPSKLDQPSAGGLTRQRYYCDTEAGSKVLKLASVSQAAGDDFVANVNHDGPSARTLYTVLGTAPAKSQATMRPNLPLATDDGAGTYSGSLGKYTTPAAFVTAVTPEAIDVDDDSCDKPGVNLDASECRDLYMKWLVGLDNGSGVYHRCKSPATEDCALIGDFFHSVPRAVPAIPNDLLNDGSYDNFKAAMVALKRPSVLYAASNDGFLHAFKISRVDPSNAAEAMQVKTWANNELWAFVPPGALPGVPAYYPGSRQLLLDGSPVIKDVVATEVPAALGYKFKLERTKDDAETGQGKWRTILVMSYGAQRPGYFALDVTDPVPSGDGGPQFLWQLVDDEAGNPLFGKGGGTPLITTVFLGGKEVAVAVLPGGSAPPSSAVAPCDRNTDLSSLTFETGYEPRDKVPCYTDDPSQKLARSLTVVRLDSGEILRTFRADPAEVPTLQTKLRVTTTPLDSPVTGQPIPFPSDVGATADRVFIGDKDGTLWRLNLTTENGVPDEWTMQLFWDGFPEALHDWNDGQPIVTPPILSVDQRGNLTVAFSTGEPDLIGGAPALANHVWSLREELSDDRLELLPKVNWHLDFTDTDQGEHVVGSMALFNENLYFATMSVPGENAGACENGQGRLWGMHYLRPNPDGPGKGGEVPKTLQDLTPSGTDDFVKADVFSKDPNVVLAGVAIAQQPTCFNDDGGSDDEYFKSGVHHGLGSTSGGKFQLFVPIGTGQVADNSKVESVDMGGAQAAAIELPTPPVLTRVDSWAAIVE